MGRRKRETLSDVLWKGIQQQSALVALHTLDAVGRGVDYVATEMLFAINGENNREEISESDQSQEKRSSSKRRSNNRRKGTMTTTKKSTRKSSSKPSRRVVREKSRTKGKNKSYNGQRWTQSEPTKSVAKEPSVALYRHDMRDDESEFPEPVQVSSLIERFDDKQLEGTRRTRQLVKKRLKEKAAQKKESQITEVKDSFLGNLAEELGSVLDENPDPSSDIFRPRPDSFGMDDSSRFGYLRGERRGRDAPISPLTPFESLHASNKKALFDGSTGASEPVGTMNRATDQEINDILFSGREMAPEVRDAPANVPKDKSILLEIAEVQAMILKLQKQGQAAESVSASPISKLERVNEIKVLVDRLARLSIRYKQIKAKKILSTLTNEPASTARQATDAGVRDPAPMEKPIERVIKRSPKVQQAEKPVPGTKERSLEPEAKVFKPTNEVIDLSHYEEEGLIFNKPLTATNQ